MAKVKFVDEKEKSKGAMQEPYDIVADVLQQPITTSFGQLLKQNALYRKQVRSFLARK